MLSIAEWIAVGTILIAALAGVAGAYFQSRRPADREAEKPYRPRPVALRIADEDRSLLSEIRDAITGHGRVIERHGERLDDHRRAVGDAGDGHRRG